MKDLKYYKKVIPIWEEYLQNKWKKDYTTLYIHFPYCMQRCAYCMHHNYLLKTESDKDEYLEIIEEQFKIAQPIFYNESIKSLYIGGGSPSLLSVEQTMKLLDLIEKYFKIDPSIDNMFSIESHASQLTKEKMDLLSKSYINRVSVGVQSLDNRVLLANNRILLGDDFFNNLIYLLNAFYEKKDRINIDLMYGLEEQTEESFLKDVFTFMNLEIPKITVYGYRNETKNRPIKNEDKYQKHFTEAMKKINSNKYKMYSPEIYQEFNPFIHKKMGPRWIYQYNTEPAYFNNIISFGLGRHTSFFTPIEKTIHFDRRIRIDTLEEMLSSFDIERIRQNRKLKQNKDMFYDYEYFAK